MSDDESIDIVLKKIYIFPQIIGTFPFTLKRGTFRISYFLCIYSIILYVSIGIKIWEILFKGPKHSLFFPVLFSTPNISLFILATSNFIWFSIKLKKMNSFLHLLVSIQNSIKAKLKVSIWFKVYLIILIIMDFFCNMIVRAIIYYNDGVDGDWATYVLMSYRYAPVLAIVDQFSSVLEIVRMILKETCNALSPEKSEELIEVVEMLRESCGLLNHCYSLQILLFLSTAVIYDVTTIYALVIIRPVFKMFAPTIGLVFIMSATLRLTMSCWRASVQVNKILYKYIYLIQLLKARFHP